MTDEPLDPTDGEAGAFVVDVVDLDGAVDVDRVDADEVDADEVRVDEVQDAPKAPAARRARWAPRTRVAVASLALIAMMFLFVFPTRSYLAQKRQVGNAAHAVSVLKAQNEVLAREAERLQTPSEIERLAREEFNMVLPGEQAYNIVHAVPGSTPAPTTAPTTTTVP